MRLRPLVWWCSFTFFTEHSRERSNRAQTFLRERLSPSADARPRGQSPVPSESRNAGRMALCPGMSLAPAAVRNPSFMASAELGGGTIFVTNRHVNFARRREKPAVAAVPAEKVNSHPRKPFASICAIGIGLKNLSAYVILVVWQKQRRELEDPSVRLQSGI